MAIYNASLLISASNATYFTNTTGGIAAVDVRGLNESWISSSALLTGSNTFVGNQIISGNVDINGTISASLQTGYLFVGDGNGRTQAVATSSIIANTDTGSLLVTASFSEGTRNITFTKGNSTTFNLGGFATTGSNTFTAQQYIDSPSNYGGTGLTIVSASMNFAGVGGRINFPNGGYFLGNPGDVMTFATDGVGQQFNTGDSSGSPSARNIQFKNTSPNGNIQLEAQNNGQVQLSGSATTIQGLRYPIADGTAGQAIVTNGFGTLTFGNVSINTGSFATTGSNTFNGQQIINIPTGLAPAAGIVLYNTGSDASGSMRLGITDPGNPFIQLKNKTWFQFGVNDELQYQSFTSSFDNGIIVGPYYTASEKVRIMPRSSSLQFSQDIGAGEKPILTLGVPSAIGTEKPSIFNTNVTIANTNGNLTFAQTGGSNSGIQFPDVKLYEDSSLKLIVDSPTGVNINGPIALISSSLGGKINFPNNAQLSGVTGDQFKFSANETSTQFLINSSSSPLNMIFENRGNNGQTQFLTNGNEFHSASSYTFNGGDVTINGNVYANNLTGSAISGYATLGANTFTGSQTIAPANGQPTLTLSGSIQNNVNFLAPGTFFNVAGGFSFNNNGPSGGSGSLTFSAMSASVQIGADSGLYISRVASPGGGPASTGQAILINHSGSLLLSNTTSTPTAVSHLSSSQANANTNLIFKTNSNTASTIISSSANIFVNPAAGLAGFTRYAGFGNIALNGSNLPQISGSMAFSPTMNNNYLGGPATTIVMRGPVSSSAWNINSNNVLGAINVGTSAANDASKCVSGLTIQANNVVGALQIIASANNLTNPIQATQNMVNGNFNLVAQSSSIVAVGNMVSDNSVGVTNNFYSSSLGTGSAVFSRNIVNGVTNAVLFTGTLDAGATAATPSMAANYIGGNTNTFFSNATGAGTNHSMTSVMAHGYQLIVSASSNPTINTGAGSAFFGRYNSQDGNRPKSAETVFAVGTGTSGSAGISRKTGFLIDSGSNSYFEGSLNVSGSTSFTGSVAMSSYAVLASVSSSLNFADDTAAAAGGVPLGGLYRNGNFVMIRLT